MIIVVDASTVVAALVSSDSTGTWAEEVVIANKLFAPHLMPIEVANILRRLVISRQISADIGALAHRDLQELPVDFITYELLADRVWALHPNVTAYDACYVATAELLNAPLATLDGHLTRASGPTCSFETPT